MASVAILHMQQHRVGNRTTTKTATDWTSGEFKSRSCSSGISWAGTCKHDTRRWRRRLALSNIALVRRYSCSNRASVYLPLLCCATALIRSCRNQQCVRGPSPHPTHLPASAVAGMIPCSLKACSEHRKTEQN